TNRIRSNLVLNYTKLEFHYSNKSHSKHDGLDS
ncbi:unnamed protein product, partial [Rotaria magnacalcarata]